MYPVLAFRVLRAFALFNCHLDMGPVLASCLTELEMYTLLSAALSAFVKR